ncbi:MAG: preprotein translocase subunit SecG [Candidatus Poribacteria bacterium]
MIIGFFIFIFVIASVLLTVIILMQDTKGEGLASGVFGGSGAEALLGGRGAATFLSKLTTYLAIAYIVLALILAKFYGTTSHKIPTKPETEENQTATEGKSAEGTIQMPSEDAGESTGTDANTEGK